MDNCKLCRRDVSPLDNYCRKCKAAHFNGIGGWLNLIALQLMGATATAIFFTLGAVLMLLDGAAKGIEWAYAIINALVLLGISSGMVYITVLFCTLSRKFLHAYRALLLITAVSVLYPAVMNYFFDVELESGFTRNLITTLGLVAISFMYLHFSRRVKNTFVN